MIFISPTEGGGGLGTLFSEQVPSALAGTWHFLVCKTSHDLLDGLEPNLHGYKLGP